MNNKTNTKLSEPFTPKNLVDILRIKALSTPEKQLFTFISEGKEDHVTYGELDIKARSIALYLLSVTKRGANVLIMHQPGLEYIAAFFGCLYAGVTAVPIYPPGNSRHMKRVLDIAADTYAEIALTSSLTLSMIQRAQSKFSGLEGIQWIATDAIPIIAASDYNLQDIKPDGIAFLQYTSGSTGNPKGVILRHNNLLDNLKHIKGTFGLSPESTLVSWLPPYHDMGLIGGILQPIYTSFHCILMSPASFLQSPIRWLKAISQYNATVSGGPNFAYDLCVRRIAEDNRKELDLSSWKVAFNGAEPIRKETLQQFADMFEPCGFQKNSFFPCYGLAEATLMVSGKHISSPYSVYNLDKNMLANGQIVFASESTDDAQSFIGCGSSMPRHKISIVDPATKMGCEKNHIGEIWLMGDSIAKGYWNQPDETAEVFAALRQDTGEGPFLRTGDLGFVKDGDLVITGRIKDMIIIRGRNYYPQDIEYIAEKSHPALQTGIGAAFSLSDEEEDRLVVAHEVARNTKDLDKVVLSIRDAVAMEYGIQVYTVVLVKQGSLPKTSSGKVRRKAAKEAFLTNTLDVLIIDQAEKGSEFICNKRQTTLDISLLVPGERQSILAAYLREQAAYVLHMDSSRISLDESLMAYGLDSLMVVELLQNIRSGLGITIPMDSLLGGLCIRQIVRDILLQFESEGAIKPSIHKPIERIKGTKGLSLSSEQQRFWYLEQMSPGNPSYHVSAAIRLKGSLDIMAMEQSLDEIIKRHDILHSRFYVHQGVPVCDVLPSEPFKLNIQDLCKIPLKEREKKARLLATELVQYPFDLTAGVLIHSSLLRLDDEEHILVVVLHHISADGWSVGALFRQLEKLYPVFAHGTLLPPPDFSIQYTDFAAWINQNQTSEILAPQIQYWENQLENLPELNLTKIQQVNDIIKKPGSHVFHKFSPELYKSICEFSKREGVTNYMVLLAAFSILLHKYTGQEDIGIGSPIIGRDSQETEELIGPFANTLVMRMAISGNPDFREVVKRARIVALKGYANKDVPFGKLVEVLKPDRIKGRNPLFQVMLGLIKDPIEKLHFPGLILENEDLETGNTDFDLFLTVIEGTNSMNLRLGYSHNYFDEIDAAKVLKSFEILLENAVANPETQLDNLMKKIPGLEYTIAISSTYTAEPIEDSLLFWMRKLNIRARISFAPYNQLLQSLLDPESLYARNTDGVNVALVRLEDWLHYNKKEMDILETKELLDRNAYDLVNALKAFTKRSMVPVILLLCPNSSPNKQIMRCCNEVEEWLFRELSGINGLNIITGNEIDDLYAVYNKFDETTDELGHIPYTMQFFTAAGTILARKIFSLNVPPIKVIVLDCDNTLWHGSCAEDGPLGIDVGLYHKQLQEFMLLRHNAGILLCLCSKNIESDVMSVFEKQIDMPLKRDHFTSWRINWQSKSQNIRSIADELDLSLDSFIFIDDDKIECEEVKANCPEVLVANLPQNAEEIPGFLNHLWVLDLKHITEEDTQRAQFYRQNIQREQIYKGVNTLKEFIDSLQLKVSIMALTEENLNRAAQLTERTNQFNTTTLRRSDVQIQHLCSEEGYKCVLVDVKDRFGDYGLVGMMLFAVQKMVLTVDSFLLSCRALGRGVEYKMLAYLADTAQELGISTIDIIYISSNRNQPVFTFLNGIEAFCSEHRPDGEHFIIPVAEALSLSYQPDYKIDNEEQREIIINSTGWRLDSENLQHIASELLSTSQISMSVQQTKMEKARDISTVYEAPRTPIERKVTEIWSELLGIQDIGIHDHFFDLGGHSLQITQLVSRIREAFDVQIPIKAFLVGTTVAALSSAIEEQIIEQADEDEINKLLKELEQLSDEEVAMLLEDNLNEERGA